MLHKLNDLDGSAIHATDGDIGHVTDYYFDDKQWVVRYLVVKTGPWLTRNQILLSPISIKKINREDKTLTVSISREQVKNSPSIDTQKPISRQYEVDHLGFYGYPFYWQSVGVWGGYPSPEMISPNYTGEVQQTVDDSSDTQHVDAADIELTRQAELNHHLRSSLAVEGYHLEVLDGDLGHLQGMIIDSDTWAIRYLIINTSNWWLGHLVLIAPQWVSDVNWVTSKIYVDVTQQQVKEAPIFDSSIPLTREYEQEIYRHYNRSNG